MKNLNFLFVSLESPEFQEIISYLKAKDLHFKYQLVDRKPSLIKALRQQEWDVLLIDDAVPGARIEDALKIAVQEHPVIPKIVLLENLTEEVVVNCLQNGASDLVLKKNFSRLVPSIQNALVQNREGSVIDTGRLLEKYDYIINSSKSFLSLIDKRYTYVAINNSLRNAHNLRKNEILGKKLSDIWGRKKFTESIKPNLDKCFGGDEVHYKAWFETPTIGMRFYEVSFAPYRNSENEISHVIVETKDITKEREMEEKIVQTESEVVSIIENSNDYFWSVDKDFNVLYTNQLFKNVFFNFYKALLEPGTNIIEQLPENEKVLWIERYTRGFQGEHFTFEQSYLVEGELLYFEVTINPILNTAKEITGLSCMSTDVTLRKKSEEKIQIQSEDLALVNKLNNAVNEGLELPKIMSVLGRETKRMFGGLGAIIYLISRDGKTMNPVIIPLSTKLKNELERITGLKIKNLSLNIDGAGHYAKTLDGLVPVLSETAEQITRVYKAFVNSKLQEKLIPLVAKLLNIKAILSLPLYSEGAPIGVLDISRHTYFSEQEVERLSHIAIQITSILKRKLADVAILDSERRFRHLFESANDAIFILKDNIFVECNEKTLDLFRANKEQVLGKNPVELSPEYQPNGEKSSILALNKLTEASKGHPVRFDWVHSRPDGSSFFTEVSLNLIKIGDEPLIQAIVRDITIRKESELLLKESEERFRAIFEDAADAIFLQDPDTGYILDANRAACSLMKRPKEELISRHKSELHPPEPGQKVKKEMVQTRTDLKATEEDFRYICRPDGELVPVDIQSRLIKIGGKKVIQSAFRDISERFKAQKELAEKEKTLRESQRIGHLGSWQIDIQTREVKWSDETYNILGYEIGKINPSYENWKARVHEDDWQRVSKAFDTAIKNKTDYESHFRIIRPNGELRYLVSKAEMNHYASTNRYELIGSIHDLTEFRQVENALRESEGKFRTLFYEGHFPMLLADIIHPERSQPNKAFLKLFGYTDTELKELKIIDLTHPDDKDRTLQIFEDLKKGQTESLEIEKRYLHKDGTVIWGQTGGATIKDDTGQTQFVIIQIIDITREKVAEHQIRERTQDLSLINNLNLQANSNLPLDTMLSYFSDQVWKLFKKASLRLMLWDEEKKQFTFRHVRMPGEISKEVAKLLGGDPVGHSFKPLENSIFYKQFTKREASLITDKKEIKDIIDQILNNSDNPKAGETIIELLKIKSVLNFPLSIGDEILGAALFVCPEVLDTNILGRLSNIIEQFTGILKRKVVEEEEAKLYSVIEQLTETVVITDKDGLIQYANPAFEASSGYSRRSAIGKTPGILKSGKQSEAFYKDLWDTILTGNTWSGKLVNKHKNGQFYEEEVNISPVKDENGKILNFVAVKRDITKEKLLEAQLQQAQKLETIGTLAGGIAHDFNNILGTLLGYNEMVLEEVPANSDAKNYSEQMKNAMNRAKTLVNQILTFSRKKEPEKKLISITELLNESISMFESIVAKNIKLNTEICTDCAPIFADPAQMQQVFMNLLTNAGQVLKTTGGTINVSLEPVENTRELKDIYPVLKSDRLMRFTVSDDGPGMDEKIQSRIFEPFFTTKPVGEGTGLGLSVVHGITKNHNAAIEVESYPGKGTRFSVYLQVPNPE